MSDYSCITDEELVSLCRKNDEVAWRELCIRYSFVSRAIVSKYGIESSEKDDACQEGLLGFLSAVHSYKSSESVSFKTYAWACMRNRILNSVVSKKGGTSVFSENCRSLDDSHDIADFSLSPEEAAISKNEMQAIMIAISDKLTAAEQSVIRLYLSGKTYNEISQTLSMSVKAVDGALQRARKKLKAELMSQ